MKTIIQLTRNQMNKNNRSKTIRSLILRVKLVKRFKISIVPILALDDHASVVSTTHLRFPHSEWYISISDHVLNKQLVT